MSAGLVCCRRWPQADPLETETPFWSSFISSISPIRFQEMPNWTVFVSGCLPGKMVKPGMVVNRSPAVLLKQAGCSLRLASSAFGKFRPLFQTPTMAATFSVPALVPVLFHRKKDWFYLDTFFNIKSATAFRAIDFGGWIRHIKWTPSWVKWYRDFT